MSSTVTGRPALVHSLLRPVAARQRFTAAVRRSSFLVVHAEADAPAPRRIVAAPKGVTLPPRDPVVPPAKFGFVDYAERINSRAAMIGFFGLLLVELVAGRGILEMVGIQIGSGLGFEF